MLKFAIIALSFATLIVAPPIQAGSDLAGDDLANYLQSLLWGTCDQSHIPMECASSDVKNHNTGCAPSDPRWACVDGVWKSVVLTTEGANSNLAHLLAQDRQSAQQMTGAENQPLPPGQPRVQRELTFVERNMQGNRLELLPHKCSHSELDEKGRKKIILGCVNPDEVGQVYCPDNHRWACDNASPPTWIIVKVPGSATVVQEVNEFIKQRQQEILDQTKAQDPGAKYQTMKNAFTHIVFEPIKVGRPEQDKAETLYAQQKSGMARVGTPVLQGMKLQETNQNVPATWGKTLKKTTTTVQK